MFNQTLIRFPHLVRPLGIAEAYDKANLYFLDLMRCEWNSLLGGKFLFQK